MISQDQIAYLPLLPPLRSFSLSLSLTDSICTLCVIIALFLSGSAVVVPFCLLDSNSLLPGFHPHTRLLFAHFDVISESFPAEVPPRSSIVIVPFWGLVCLVPFGLTCFLLF